MIIKNNGDYVRHIGVRLIPGINKVLASQEDSFNQAKDYPLNKYLLDSGEIEVVGQADGNTDVKFAELNADQAIDLVRDTYSLDLLNEFRDDEAQNKKRSTVLGAIDEQIAEVRNNQNSEGDGSQE